MSSSPLPSSPHFLVIGGGIAGVTCAETLHVLRPDSKISLISATTLVKSVSNLRQVGKLLQEFEVEEKSATELERRCPNVRVIQGKAVGLNADDKSVVLADGRVLAYDKLCVCTGATPKLVADDNPSVVGIRDVESVVAFQRKLSSARRVCVVGNGGISLELVYEISDCQVVWAIRHGSIGNTFFDAGAAQFLAPRLFEKPESNAPDDDAEAATKPVKRRQFESELVNGVPVFTKNPRGGGGLEGMERIPTTGGLGEEGNGVIGSALGPDWKESLNMKGAMKSEASVRPSSSSSGTSHDKNNVVLEYRVEVKEILTPDELRSRSDLAPPRSFRSMPDNEREPSDAAWPVYVVLSNGHVWGVDFVVSATGVEPSRLPLFQTVDDGAATFATSTDDGGILVDSNMRTSVPNVYAAGDAATADWEPAPNWFQMRLWSQARQMGGAAAKSMVAEVEGEIDRLPQDFCFECFAHVTKFFDYKCVLIGRYNAQGLEEEEDYHVILRTTPGVEYIKLVVANDRIRGAVMIGETDLEETFENLILNQFDISRFEEDILDPDVDIEDYFD